MKLDSVTVQKFLSTLMVPCPMPDAKAFGRSQEVLDWHFGGCSTDDYPAMIVEIEWDNGSVTTLSTHSNHAHLLPWKIESENTVESYLPDISMTLSELLPDSFLSQKRLASSDAIFVYEAEIREHFRKRDEQTKAEEPELSHDELKAKLDAFFDQQYDEIAHGEAVTYSREKRDYSANQLRRLSENELRELVASGYDLSSSDETGQTALMYAAFPPFNLEQFQKLVRVGADVDARRTDGMTGLMLACAGWMEDATEQWLVAGASVDLRGPGNCTALMLGAKCRAIVENLLLRGASVSLKDDDGDTALDYAMDDLCVMRAGSRLDAVTLLSMALANEDPTALRRSHERAIETARRTRLDIEIQKKFQRRTMSEKLEHANENAELSKAHTSYLADLSEFIDIEITEIELADRIVATIESFVVGLDAKG